MRLNAGNKVIALLMFTLTAGTAHAQTADEIQRADDSEEIADIEALIDASATPEGAIAAARAQVEEGDVSGAATTLERALITDPDSIKTRTYYISLLCFLDDQLAVDFEIGKLAGAEVIDEDWNEVEQACGPKPKP